MLKATAVRSPLQRCSGVNVINSSLFINSSWSSLSFTSHAVFCRGGDLAGGVWPGGGSGRGGVGGGWGLGGGGQGTFWSSCHILHYHMVLRPKGTSHNHKTLFDVSIDAALSETSLHEVLNVREFVQKRSEFHKAGLSAKMLRTFVQRKSE